MKKILLGLVLLFAFVTFTEASSKIALRRPSNLSNKLLGHAYGIIGFASNTAIKLLNIALRLSESLIGRIVHKIFHIVGIPLFVVHKIYRIISWPARMLLRPVKALIHAILIRFPRRLINGVIHLVEFIVPTRSTPFPHLPKIEFIYGH